MGKHAAADGASADPIVAAALAARPAETPGAHAADGARANGENPVGWPGAPAPEGGGLGWPADADAPEEAGTDTGADAAATEAPPLRRSWRRLFGASRVA